MRAIRRVVKLNKPKNEVFKTIFTKKYYSQWLSVFGGAQMQGELVEGSFIEFQSKNHGSMGALVHTYIKNKELRLDYSYQVTPAGEKYDFKEIFFEKYEFEDDLEDENKSFLTITFSSDDSCINDINELWDKAIDILIDLYR